MANTLKFKRGLVAGIPTAALGEPLFTTDTFDLYIGNGTTNTRFQKYIASGATTQILRGDGSLYTFPLAISSPSAGQVLKYNGTSWVNDSDAGITGSGSAGQVAYFTGATTQAGSNNLFWDATNSRLGVGTNAPAVTLDVRNGVNLYSFSASFPSAHYLEIISNSNTDGYVNFRRVGAQNGPAAYYITGGNARFSYDGATGNTILGAYTNNPLLFFTNSLQRAIIFATGNFGIGTGASDTGEKLQVTGTMKVTGQSVLATTSGATSVGIGVTSPTYKLDIEGGADYQQLRIKHSSHVLALLESTTATRQSLISFKSPTRQYAVGLQTDGTFSIYDNTAAATRVLLDASGNLGLGVTPSAWSLTGSSVVQVRNTSFYAYGNDGGLVSNAYFNTGFGGWFHIATARAARYEHVSGNHQWFISTSGTTGTAVSFTQAMTLDASGNLGIGTTSPAQRLHVVGTESRFGGVSSGFISIYNASTRSGYIQANAAVDLRVASDTDPMTFYVGGSERGRISTAGNLMFGSTTDSGEKLQVTGTAKITGASSFGGIATFTTNAAPFYGLRVLNFSGLTTDRQIFLGVVNDLYQTVGNAYYQNSNLFRTTTTTGSFIDFSQGTFRVFTDTGLTANTDYTPTLRFSISSSGSATFNSSLTVAGNLAVDTNTLFVDATNNRVGILTTTPSYSLHVQGTGYFNDNVRFPNLKGVVFVQSGGSLLGSISMDSSNQVTIDNNGFFGLSVGTSYNLLGGNTGIGTSSFGTSATRTFAMLNGTAPSSSPVDSFQLYSNDVTAGNAAPHFRTENGAVIKLYQETTAVGNSIFLQGGGNSVLDDSTFDGYTLRQIVKALRNQGILA